MKLYIFFALLSFNLYFVCARMVCKPDKPVQNVCPTGMEWKEGPTWDCDNQVCRGARPMCEDETARIMGCFCKKANQSKDGDKCVTQCPLYP